MLATRSGHKPLPDRILVSAREHPSVESNHLLLQVSVQPGNNVSGSQIAKEWWQKDKNWEQILADSFRRVSRTECEKWINNGVEEDQPSDGTSNDLVTVEDLVGTKRKQGLSDARSSAQTISSRTGKDIHSLGVSGAIRSFTNRLGFLGNNTQARYAKHVLDCPITDGNIENIELGWHAPFYSVFSMKSLKPWQLEEYQISTGSKDPRWPRGDQLAISILNPDGTIYPLFSCDGPSDQPSNGKKRKSYRAKTNDESPKNGLEQLSTVGSS